MRGIRDYIKNRFYILKYKNNFQGKGRVILGDEDFLKLNKSSKINLEGNLRLNVNRMGKNGRSSVLRMDDHTQLNVNGGFSFMYGADIILFSNSILTLGKDSFINSDCKIRCHKQITIGDDCAISHDFTVMDSNAHSIDGDKHINPVNIGNHVWIGTRVTILSGVTVGDGAVIAAGSLVTQNVPEKSVVAGIPARVVKRNVTWSK